AGDAHERASEVWRADGGGFVGENAGVKLLRQPDQRSVPHAIAEAQTFEIYLGAQLQRGTGLDRNGRGERVRQHAVGQARHHAQMLADLLVVRDVQVVKLRAVVVAGEARQL